jgi:glycosyltransferase involved in cell wall biosynthesis
LCDLSIYSFSRLTSHPALGANNCTISYPPASFGNNSLLKILFFLWRIRKDHAQKAFSATHGFWIMSQGITAVLAAKMLRIPSIVSLLGGDVVYFPTIGYGSMRTVAHKKMTTWCIKNADRVTVLTRFQEQMMNANGVSREDVSIIPFGVNITQFSFRPHAMSGRLEFIFIGNLNKVKDPYTAIRTFSLLTRNRDCHLTVVGSDTLDGGVQEYARSLNVYERIAWKGKVLHEAIPSLLHSSDFLLLTSLFEGEAVVVMEAFACGVLVAGTRVGLLADVPDDDVTVESGDAIGLAEKIERLISQPERLQEMRVKNRKLAEHYSIEWTCSGYIRLYEEVVKNEK